MMIWKARLVNNVYFTCRSSNWHVHLASITDLYRIFIKCVLYHEDWHLNRAWVLTKPPGTVSYLYYGRQLRNTAKLFHKTNSQVKRITRKSLNIIEMKVRAQTKLRYSYIFAQTQCTLQVCTPIRNNQLHEVYISNKYMPTTGNLSNAPTYTLQKFDLHRPHFMLLKTI